MNKISVVVVAGATALAFGGMTVAAQASYSPRHHRDTNVYSGTGFKLLNNIGITHLDLTVPYVFTFGSAADRTTLTPYVQDAANQLHTITGGTFTVSTTVESYGHGTKPPSHHILLSTEYRPLGSAGMSQAEVWNDGNRATVGGHIYMDSEYFTNKAWFSNDPVVNKAWIKNAVTHEIGHESGLDHPSTAGISGVKPIMTSPNGGWLDSRAGQFTSYDINGLKALKANT